MLPKFIKALIYIIPIFILSCAVFFIILYIQVVGETLELIDRGAIQSTIFSESPVYYDDGSTPIGVFFEKTHSKYINYNDIPRIYVKAIIASEDKNFFEHHGFDLRAILRAFIVNLKAGKVIQGGSTITQQTAKNIFKREKKTYMAKLKELIQAMLLERRYTKEEILEIYINQFFVTGFGKGLGIASEYFFDKEVKDINMVEAAFLAGMVKGPYRYNPFTGKTDEEKNWASRLAKERKDYVLKNMKALYLITEEEYVKATEQEVPFKEGKVTFGLNVVMDYVRQQMESDYFRGILREQGLENIATSGINIYTSISKTIQEGALNSLRNQLPALDIQLSGFKYDLNEERYREKMGMTYNEPLDNLPFFSNIIGINNDTENISIEVKWADNREGVIDYQGLKPIGEAWFKWKYGSSVEFSKKYALEFLKNFQVGDSIPVQYREETGDTPLMKQLYLCEIPDLEGGVIVLNQGMIKAMVGGFFDRHFNRAVDAKRQLGSIFKPIVYTAALQLKWNNLDSLTNIHDLYEFENTYYIPRPDHEPKNSAVSMTWAGAKSENLASVWLLYHLTDRLNMSEFRQVTDKLGLARTESETYYDYVKRIRDRHGVIVNGTSLLEAAFEQSKKDIESDLIFGGNEKALENLYRIHFDINKEDIKSQEKNDIMLSRFSFNRLRRINSDLKKSFQDLKEGIAFLSGSNGRLHIDNYGRIIYYNDSDYMNSKDTGYISTELSPKMLSGIEIEDIWVDGLLPSGVIDLLRSSMNKRYKELQVMKKYDINVLYYVRDFRTLVNLFYVRQLAEDMGISTPLDTVLSFPLGANSISILEAALTYNTIINGTLYSIDDEADNMIPIITRITDRKGELIWDYVPEQKKVLSSIISGSVTEILRMAVENGTAIRAKDSINLSMEFDEYTLKASIPSFGKTGTSNQFSNSSFVGFIPGIYKGGFSLDKGYVIASYVGYDDNRPMKGSNTIVYGSSGALPIWIDSANAIINSAEYRKDIEMADLAFNLDTSTLVNSDILNPVKVSPNSGLPLSADNSTDSDAVEVYTNVEINNEEITLKRVFEPLKGVEFND